MQRSRINAAIEEAIGQARRHGLPLPRFAVESNETLASKGEAFDEARACGLGWNVTDFGSGNFEKMGLVTLNLRSGNPSFPAYAGKVYSEKLLFLGPQQRVPMHYHAARIEDVICCAGEKFYVAVYSRAANGEISDGATDVSIDGERRKVPCGDAINLKPGDSICLTPGLLHEFYTGDEPVILRAIATVSDDAEDMLFVDGEDHERYPDIVDDVPADHLMSGNR